MATTTFEKPMGSEVETLKSQIGTLSSLTTSAKSSAVAAINEVNDNKLDKYDAGTITATDVNNAIALALQKAYTAGMVNATKEMAVVEFLYENEPYMAQCIGKGNYIYFICYTWNKIYNGWWEKGTTQCSDFTDVNSNITTINSRLDMFSKSDGTLKQLNSVDLNSCLDSGIFYANTSCTNKPVNTSGYFQVLVYSKHVATDMYAIQYFQPWNSDTMYFRRMSGGQTWGTWKSLTFA